MVLPLYYLIISNITKPRIAVEIPIIDWNGQQLVRISVQGYNTRGDVKALIEALAALLQDVMC